MMIGLAALPLSAQTAADPNRGAGDTHTSTGMPRATDMDDDFNLGWLGLLGLAGLAGMRRRPHTHIDTHTSDVRPGGTSRI